ncbi:hypothetical protein A2291_08190 [candidate division WOR-1 bacterium RIFOXYB2_FULL_42_35]|uniref:DDH domain-containing protein n=1 Tax=candidate division WOR-1 bacterium RIFOXYC2_FULL_41_25 TaxID=1802586 RepID=A0A1F4TIV1_UNCSA|nr:MAG: hypothetical protein A2247_01875 [candidate division WOR-1 bacterium RIFOXYA2_FULL_41_14]OGC24066.1 MAG: hypothetical protein A2291_08190 [candidate division WOR-1 bacterium RIFOXYB2_FULL_42_35]OGC32489.1 MAG: hypothetical protein A2462_00285 [candidate division WOR-1 bacterium RIFOXYC2_FULL_41_25]OGC42327.1 MAG: hypothetical protein A2548_08235 [candidate division WOR-1 bacterium RIFOXYD2_FULL_41_8]
MTNKKLFETIKKNLKKADNAIVAVHVDPDGDTIGSALTMAMVLESFGVATTIYSEDGIPEIYHFLPLAEKVVNKIAYKVHFDLAIALDASDISRVGEKINLREVASFLINIDHHPDNTNYADINYVEKRSSTAECLYQLCKYLKIKINKEMAACLYTALITDTGNFRYENTSVDTFLMAADLLRAGLNTHEITTNIYDTRSIPSLRIAARALSQMEFSADHKVGWTVITKKMMAETRAKGEDLIGIVDQLRSVKGIEVAILFREEKGKVKLNLRSKHDVNVSTIASLFDGGGHNKAAGAIIEGNVEDVKNRVLTEVLKHVRV